MITCCMRPAILCLLLLAALAPAAWAETSTPPPGEYITERGWGVLRVTAQAGKTMFTLNSIGGNMHVCSLEGEIGNGRASLEADEGNPCRIDFTVRSDGIEVSGNEACRYFCGVRAFFSGVYLKPPSGCTGAEQAQTREDFKRLFDRKKFAEARATLEPLLARCGRILGWLDDGWIRNDLALTQHKLGDEVGCRWTLQPLAADAAKSDEEITGAFPPSDAEAYLPIVKATRTNLKLCAAAKSPKR